MKINIGVYNNTAHASLDGNPDITGFGESAEEALGRLILENGEMFGMLEVKVSDLGARPSEE